MTEPPPSPEPTVVEWGDGERRPRLGRLASWQHPGLPWSLAGLGAVALFGSLIGEWQRIVDTTGESFGDPSEPLTMGIGSTVVWGVSWLVGAALLAVCVGLALAGQPSIRPYVRTIGLALAAVQLGILVAAAVSLSQESLLVFETEGVEFSLGRGVYAAFASVLLLGAALSVARTQLVRPAAAPERSAEGDPDDLVVGPADPLVHPTDDHTWR